MSLHYYWLLNLSGFHKAGVYQANSLNFTDAIDAYPIPKSKKNQIKITVVETSNIPLVVWIIQTSIAASIL